MNLPSASLDSGIVDFARYERCGRWCRIGNRARNRLWCGFGVLPCSQAQGAQALLSSRSNGAQPPAGEGEFDSEDGEAGGMTTKAGPGSTSIATPTRITVVPTIAMTTRRAVLYVMPRALRIGEVLGFFDI